VSATPDVNAPAVPAMQRRRRRSGFGAAAFAFLIVMAVATLPSPLYGLYRTRDHLSALTITVVFAIFAGSTIAILRRDSSIAARIGLRGSARARNGFPARGPGAARCIRAPFHTEPGDVPDRGCADRRGFWCCSQGDHRDRAWASPPEGRAPNTVLGFAILVGLGVVVSGWALLGRRQLRPQPEQVHP
jgi:hypothetical protein